MPCTELMYDLNNKYLPGRMFFQFSKMLLTKRLMSSNKLSKLIK